MKVSLLHVHACIHGSTELLGKLYFSVSGALEKLKKHTVLYQIPHVSVTVNQIFTVPKLLR